MKDARPRRSARAGVIFRHTLKQNSIASPSPSAQSLYVEAEEHHVAVLYDVVLALRAHLSLFLRGVVVAAFDERLPVDDLGADETLFKVGVYLSRRLRRLGAALDRPRARLLFARGEVGDEA